jgi:hypothetical protein
MSSSCLWLQFLPFSFGISPSESVYITSPPHLRPDFGQYYSQDSGSNVASYYLYRGPWPIC